MSSWLGSFPLSQCEAASWVGLGWGARVTGQCSKRREERGRGKEERRRSAG